jgi:hypothetical protein
MGKKSARLIPTHPTLSGLILLATSLHLFLGLVTHALWLLRGNQALFRYYFGYQDPLFLLACAVVELSLSYAAWKQFAPGQSLRRAWLLIMVSALCHVLGMVLSHILTAGSYINPLYVLHRPWLKATQTHLAPIGMFIGGPVHMVTLAVGLFIAYRLCRRFETRSKLKPVDWIILGFVVAYTLMVAYVVVRLRWSARPAPGFTEVMNWANDPLLCLLLFFAFFLRRSLVQMGWGFVTKCWGAYVVAILGTSVASMGLWLANFGILPYPESATLWYVWPIVYAAYALGPTYQVEAARVAVARLDDLGLELKLDATVRPH